MAAQPPKLSHWSERLADESPDTLHPALNVPTSWNLFTGALGYWLPNALNRTHRFAAAIRGLR